MKQEMKTSRETKRPVQVKMYKESAPGSYVGWVENKSKSWILYFDAEGHAIFYPKREASGAVIGEGVYTNPLEI